MALTTKDPGLADSPLNKILQSEPVRKLFNQPNIVIHAIPRSNSPTAYRMVKPKQTEFKTNGINEKHQLKGKAHIKNGAFDNLHFETNNEEENLLPSKYNGKSEILLVPIVRKQKECGHFEPCESLVCDVSFQQYEDDNGVASLISTNISEDELNNSVLKHCKCNKCDVVDLDHDLWQKSAIESFEFDKFVVCDICEVRYEDLQEYLNHRKCKRKEIHLNNIATPTEVFKYKMREKELQILEAAKLKRTSDYLDPVTGFTRTMKALTSNSELIVIPKVPPSRHKLLNSNFSPINSLVNYNNCSGNSKNISMYNGSSKSRSYKNRKSLDTDKELTSAMISEIIESCQKSIASNSQCDKINYFTPKQIKLSDHWNGATVEIKEVPNPHYNPSLDLSKIARKKVNTTKTLKKNSSSNKPGNDLADDQPILTSLGLTPRMKKSESTDLPKISPVNSNLPFEAPYKVVPIAQLKSEPSLLHQTQGVPKFCLVPDTTKAKQPSFKKRLIHSKKMSKLKKIEGKKSLSGIPPLLPKTVLHTTKFRPLLPLTSTSPNNLPLKKEHKLLARKHKMKNRPRKKILKKGKYKCTYCPKRFSSVEYSKLHIAKHENNTGFFCRLCEKGFVDKYIMKKHIDADHKSGEVRCEMCDCILTSVEELKKHTKISEGKLKRQCSECKESFDTCSSLDYHMRKEHGFLICTLCKQQIAKAKIKRHLMLEHSISKSRTISGFEKLTSVPTDSDLLCEIKFVNNSTLEPATKIKPMKENKIEIECLAKGRSARKRLSKELFTCKVCERCFENEKQYQIHIANNPMKFTACPDCGKKFHRKAEYTEHSKLCDENKLVTVPKTSKKRNLTPVGELFIEDKKEDVSKPKSQDCINDKKHNEHNEVLDSNEFQSKRIKLEEETVQKEDLKNCENLVKNSVQLKVVNGVKHDTDYLGGLKNVNKVDEDVSKIKVTHEEETCNNENVLMLNVTQKEQSFNNLAVFDKATVISNILNDHNYLAMQ